MKKDFETNFSGWLFIVAAILLWFSWLLTSHHIGEYIVASDFEAIGEDVWYWIWMYRFHIFGWVIYGHGLDVVCKLHIKERHASRNNARYRHGSGGNLYVGYCSSLLLQFWCLGSREDHE